MLIAFAADDGCAVFGNLDTRIQRLALANLSAVCQAAPFSVSQQELLRHSQAKLGVNLRAGGRDVRAD